MDNAYMQGSGYASPGRETVTNKVAKYLAADASLHKASEQFVNKNGGCRIN